METKHHRDFGQLISQARLSRGLSRREVAQAIGVHVAHYGKVERGLKLVSLMIFASLWRHLAFNAGQVLDALPIEIPDTSLRVRTRRTPRSRIELSGELAGFHRVLIRARMDAGFTQTALASAIGVSRRHVARLESGHALPSLVLFVRLRRVLGFNVDRVLGRLLGDDTPVEPFHGFGQTIKSARGRLLLSAGDVARVAECDLGHYRRIERGVLLPSMREAIFIHRAVRFDADAAMRSVWETDAIERLT